nr:hypothetical protein [Streptomyces sp. DSM 41633]
ARGGGIYALPPTGGTLRPVLRHPASASEVETTFADKLAVYSGGRAVLMRTFIGGGDDEQEKSTVSMLAFGD